MTLKDPNVSKERLAVMPSLPPRPVHQHRRAPARCRSAAQIRRSRHQFRSSRGGSSQAERGRSRPRRPRRSRAARPEFDRRRPTANVNVGVVCSVVMPTGHVARFDSDPAGPAALALELLPSVHPGHLLPGVPSGWWTMTGRDALISASCLAVGQHGTARALVSNQESTYPPSVSASFPATSRFRSRSIASAMFSHGSSPASCGSR